MDHPNAGIIMRDPVIIYRHVLTDQRVSLEVRVGPGLLS